MRKGKGAYGLWQGAVLVAADAVPAKHGEAEPQEDLAHVVRVAGHGPGRAAIEHAVFVQFERMFQ